LVVVDPTVSDYHILLSGVSPNTEVYILDKHRDGIEQITEILTGLPAEEQLSPLPPRSLVGERSLSRAKPKGGQ
jgi:hypothetical protein